MNVSKISKADIVTTIKTLRKCTFPLPQDLFFAWVEHFPVSAVELAVLRKRGGKIEILLTQRPGTDKHWPRHWHMPGTLILQNEPMRQSLKRLAISELGMQLKKAEVPTFLGIFEFMKGKGPNRSIRGHGISFLYTLRLNRKIPKGKFFPIHNLPRITVIHHRTMIRKLESLK